MDRLIEVKVGGNHLWKDSNLAGVQGEGNVTYLRISFDEGWSGYAKSITFFDAKGKNPVKRNLTTDLLEDAAKSTLVYLCKIPPEPLTEAGRCSFVIEGYVDEKRQRVVETEMEVPAARATDGAAVPGDPTPTQAEQLQAQIEAIMDDVQKAATGAQYAEQAIQYAADAKASAEAAASSEENAAASASDASSSASRAEQALSQMGTNAEAAAASAAEAKAAQAKAEAAETAAEQSADRASNAAAGVQASVDAAAQSAANAAQSAQGIATSVAEVKASAAAAKNSETNAASSASNAKASENSVASNVAKAETAKSNAESAATRAENAKAAAEDAQFSASLDAREAEANAEIASGSAQQAWEHMDGARTFSQLASASKEAAQAAQAAAEKAAESAQQASGGNFATPAYVDSKAAEAESNANKYTDEKLAGFSPSGGGDASEQISEHNADTSAHADIRAAIPTAVSQLANDSGYLSKETDPTVPAWAKVASKPSYTASEVGADASGSAAKALTDAKAYTDQKLSAIPTPDVIGQIGAHNTAADAHADIRQIASDAVTAARGAESLATSAKSTAEAAARDAEWAYDEAISKASIFYCYSDSTTLEEIDAQKDNGNIVILDEYGTLVPMTFADYGVTYVFRLQDGDRVITATVDSDGWTVHEEEVGGSSVPEDHASRETTYGKGTISHYGHVKLSDAMDSTDGSTSGVAATPLAVKTAYDKAKSAASAASTAQARADAAYSLAEANADVSGATAVSATLTTAGWAQGADGRYAQTVAVAGVTADESQVIVVDVHLTGTDTAADNEALAAWGPDDGNGPSSNNIKQGNGTLTFYCTAVPAINIPLVVGVH